jgi:hypothetical protein
VRWRSAATAVVLLVLLIAPRSVDARPCELLPIACTYEGMPFTIIVVDADTGNWVADVHALAELRH